MIWPFKNRPAATDEVYATYNLIVAQSRQEIFYADWAIPDSVTGRFDMICLHLCLVFRRMRQATDQQKAFTQALFNLFFNDMDRSLRELGVGDTSVPKRIEKMGEIFYGLLENLTSAIDSGDNEELRAVIARNFYDPEDPKNTVKLANYTIALAKRLDAQPLDQIANGTLELGEVA